MIPFVVVLHRLCLVAFHCDESRLGLIESCNGFCFLVTQEIDFSL